MKHNINRDELRIVFEEVREEYEERVREIILVDEKTKDLVIDIVIKIQNLKRGKWISIANLIDYNPQVSPTDPLSQGTISRYVMEICKKIGIKLIEDDSIGGLAYFIKFKKM